MSDPSPLLEVRKISKSFPGARALDQVSFSLRRGEVVAVIGENGAGKSTLMKLLAGLEQPDSGEIFLRGMRIHFGDVSEAVAQGIALIHQELQLLDNLTISANIFLGREQTKWGVLQEREMAREALPFLERVGLHRDPQTKVGSLSLAAKQLVEIAKALSCRAQILIMDEPTSSLGEVEVKRLQELIRCLRNEGVTILYISHRLGEIEQIADRVIGLRDGAFVGELSAGNITHEAMIQLMVGRDLAHWKREPFVSQSAAKLEVRGLRTIRDPEQPISISVRPGEVVGIAGLVGSGRSEVLRTIFGVSPFLGGEIVIDGIPVRIVSPAAAMRCGLAFVPESRKEEGLILEWGLGWNISLANFDTLSRFGFINAAQERRCAEEQREALSIKVNHLERPLAQLSGGNQQKAVFAKWIQRKPKVLLLDEPTRGVDVGAKREIYGELDRLSRLGIAILLVSSEMEEILRLCDRVYVMAEGAVRGELGASELSEEAIMHLASPRECTDSGKKRDVREVA